MAIERTACFTGHRELFSPKKKLQEEIESQITKAIQKGYTHFICGGSWGFDMLAAEQVLYLRDSGQNITLEIIVPCRDQTRNWPPKQKLRYDAVLQKANLVTKNDVPYSPEAMHERNRQMVSKSPLVIAYYKDGSGGGTLNTIEHAHKAKSEIWYIRPAEIVLAGDAKIHIVSVESFYSNEFLTYAQQISQNSLYITELISTYALRADDLVDQCNCRISAWENLLRKSKAKVIETGGSLSIQDQMHLVGKVIAEKYGGSPQAKALAKVKSKVYELFSVLMDKGITHFTPSQLSLIRSKSDVKTAGLFELYNSYSLLLQNALAENKLVSYQDAVNTTLATCLNDKNTLIIEGALWLVPEQVHLIKQAHKLGMSVYLINKENQFTETDTYTHLLSEIGVQAERTFIKGVEKRKPNSIAVASQHMFTDTTIMPPIDESLRFIEPFVSREEEYRWIVKDILSHIDKSYKSNAAQATEDIAIRFLHDDERKHFNDILKQHNASFRVKTKARTLMDFSLGRFIYNFYRIIENGPSVNAYKSILFTQWRFNPFDKIYPDIDLLYNKALHALSTLELWFKNLDNLDDWEFVIADLLAIKRKIPNNFYLQYHPLVAIDKDALQFLRDHIIFINKLMYDLHDVEAKASDHLGKLKDVISLYTDDKEELTVVFDFLRKYMQSSIFRITAKGFGESVCAIIADVEIEQRIEEKETFLPNLEMAGVVKYKRVYLPNFESGKYPQTVQKTFPFTEEILAVLSDSEIGINHNIQPFVENDHHFFIKNYLDRTDDTLLFTQSQNVGSNPMLPSLYIQDIFDVFGKNIEYEKPALETRELKAKTVIEAGGMIHRRVEPTIRPDPPILTNKRLPLANLFLHAVCPKMFLHIQSAETHYSGEMQLGLYASHILFYRFFEELAARHKDKEWKHNKEFEVASQKILKDLLDEIKSTFGYMNWLDLQDLHNRTNESIKMQLDQILQGKLSAKRFSLSLVKPKEIAVGSYTIVIDPKLVVTNLDNNQAQEIDTSKGLHILLSGSEGKEYPTLTKYDQIMGQLAKDNSDDDRIKLAAFALFKVGVQLSHPQYYNDGIVRIEKRIQEIEASKHQAVPCDYYKFSRIAHIAKGGSR